MEGLKKNVFSLLVTWLLLLLAQTSAQSYFTVANANYACATKTIQAKKLVYQAEAVNISLPITLKNDYKLLGGLLFHRVQLRFDSLEFNKAFYNTGINLGVVKKTKKGSFLAMLLGRINSDFIKISSKSYQVGGVVLLTRNLSERLSLKYGLYYNAERFGPFFAPLLGIDWKASEQWRVFGILPQNLSIENKVSPLFRWGIAYFSPNITYQVNGSNTALYLHQNQTRVGLFGDIYLTKKIVATAKIDYPMPAKYRIYADDERFNANIWGLGIGGTRTKNTAPIIQLGHGLIYQFGISYRVELN